MLKEIENLLLTCDADITLILSPDDMRKFEQEVKNAAVNKPLNVEEERIAFIKSSNSSDKSERMLKMPLMSRSFESLDLKG